MFLRKRYSLHVIHPPNNHDYSSYLFFLTVSKHWCPAVCLKVLLECPFKCKSNDLCWQAVAAAPTPAAAPAAPAPAAAPAAPAGTFTDIPISNIRKVRANTRLHFWWSIVFTDDFLSCSSPSDSSQV